jgi:hypothetical protein
MLEVAIVLCGHWLCRGDGERVLGLWAMKA